MVEEAGAGRGPKSHFTENRLREVEFSDQGHMKNSRGAKTPAQNFKLFLFIPNRPPATMAHHPTFCTLEVTYTTIC